MLGEIMPAHRLRLLRFAAIWGDGGQSGGVLVVHEDDLAVLQAARGLDDLGGAGAVPVLGVDVPQHLGEAELLLDGSDRAVGLPVRRPEQPRRAARDLLDDLLGALQLGGDLRAAELRQVGGATSCGCRSTCPRRAAP
ncbi:hypothetical protein GCM10020001_022660 [Nonomuraea salmonea]